MSIWSTRENEDGSIEWKSFGRYNIDNSIERFKPKDRGAVFANSTDIDNSNRNELTTDENEFIDDVNSYIHDLNEIYTNQSAIIDKKVVQMSKYETHNSLINKFEEEATKLFTNFKYTEETNQKERVNSKRELKLFKVQNNLHDREAIYPDSKLFHISIIMVFVIVEAVINSYFFGTASDLGLLGGFFTGLMTSGANVGLGIFDGFLFLRLANHVNTTKRVIGQLFFVLLLPMMFFLHLAIAHYRELLTRNPNAEFISTMSRVVEQPFNLQDIDSIILLIIGVFISALAIWKGYTYDDVYPGYGAVYRRWKEKEDSMIKSKKELVLKVTEEYNTAIKESHNLSQKLEKNRMDIKTLKKDVTTLFDGYESLYQQAKNGAFRLIDEYRSGIRYVIENEKVFLYSENLLSELTKPNLDMKMRTEALITSTLAGINDNIINFEQRQDDFEKRLVDNRDKRIEPIAIENIFKEIDNSRKMQERFEKEVA
jgi:hypothetical protein